MIPTLEKVQQDLDDINATLSSAWKSIKILNLGHQKEGKLYQHLNEASREVRMAGSLLELTMRNLKREPAPAEPRRSVTDLEQ